MKSESIVFAVAGMFLGLIAGWLIGSQQASVRPAVPAQQAASPPASGGSAPAPPRLDEARSTIPVGRASSRPGAGSGALGSRIGNDHWRRHGRYVPDTSGPYVLAQAPARGPGRQYSRQGYHA